MTMRLAPAASLTVMVCAASSSAVVSPKSERQSFTSGSPGAPAGGVTGASPTPHQQPYQIGRDTSPASNSIQTPAPTGGIEKNPACGPA